MAAPRKAKVVKPDFSTDGPRVASWLETYCRHTKGTQFAGKPLVLEPWQREYVNELFRLDSDGKRCYASSLLLLPRKNGKSTLAAGLALYMLCADGEMSPEVYLAANSKEQAGAVFRQMKDIVQTGPLMDWITPMRAHLEAPDCLGLARVVSADAKLQHGTNPSTAVLDELWAAKSMELLEAFESGTSAREQPLTIIISTVGHEKESPLGDLHRAAYAKPDELRETRNDGFLTIVRDLEAGFLWWLYGPPMDSDGRYSVELDDPIVWEKSNPASWVTREVLQKQRDKPSLRLSEFQRFAVNAWSEAEDFWIPQGSWDACRDGFQPIEDGARVTLGVDLGLKRDRSSVVICRRRQTEDGVYHFDAVAKVWDPPEDKNLTFDINVIRTFIQDCALKFNIERIALDPWRLEETGNYLYDSLQLEVIRFDMGWARTAPATERLYDGICSARIHHDGDPVFAAHVAAGKTTTNERGQSRLTKRKVSNPIDALVALLMAYDECAKAGSIYDDRELLIL